MKKKKKTRPKGKETKKDLKHSGQDGRKFRLHQVDRLWEISQMQGEGKAKAENGCLKT